MNDVLAFLQNKSNRRLIRTGELFFLFRGFAFLSSFISLVAIYMGDSHVILSRMGGVILFIASVVWFTVFSLLSYLFRKDWQNKAKPILPQLQDWIAEEYGLNLSNSELFALLFVREIEGSAFTTDAARLDNTRYGEGFWNLSLVYDGYEFYLYQAENSSRLISAAEYEEQMFLINFYQRTQSSKVFYDPEIGTALLGESAVHLFWSSPEAYKSYAKGSGNVMQVPFEEWRENVLLLIHEDSGMVGLDWNGSSPVFAPRFLHAALR